MATVVLPVCISTKDQSLLINTLRASFAEHSPHSFPFLKLGDHGESKFCCKAKEGDLDDDNVIYFGSICFNKNGTLLFDSSSSVTLSLVQEAVKSRTRSKELQEKHDVIKEETKGSSPVFGVVNAAGNGTGWVSSYAHRNISGLVRIFTMEAPTKQFFIHLCMHAWNWIM